MSPTPDKQARKAFVPVPANWKTMTPEQQLALTDEMAKAIQTQLAIKPKG